MVCGPCDTRRASASSAAAAVIICSVVCALLSDGAPAQDQEFVLSHADNVQATGFVEHLKLPHYVDFQSELSLVRMLRREFEDSRVGTAFAREAAE